MTWGVPFLVSYHFALSYCSWGFQGKNTEVACHSLFQWTTFCQTSPPWPFHLGWPHMAWLSFIKLDRLWSRWSDWLVFCDYGFSVSALWCPLATPTSNAEEAEWFYEDLQDLLELTPQKDVLCIIGDWNAKVWSQETPGVTGKFGLGIWNEAGQRLIEFCQENTLVIANTISQQHKRRLYIWTSPDGQHRNQIDYIICSQRWRSSI